MIKPPVIIVQYWTAQSGSSGVRSLKISTSIAKPNPPIPASQFSWFRGFSTPDLIAP
ncbi:hypothetical protein [Coleofasciculus sp. G2-EDA-02]|uniref:hypothetical protein n=1 Tax=Coleofasciculus sp. G2-EDA-02 TaxID=3069529 RepID=UPI0032F4ED02